MKPGRQQAIWNFCRGKKYSHLSSLRLIGDILKSDKENEKIRREFCNPKLKNKK
jgi:hypothetical protein